MVSEAILIDTWFNPQTAWNKGFYSQFCGLYWVFNQQNREKFWNSTSVKHFASLSVRTCEVEGKFYQDFDEFEIGVDDCGKCVCIDGGAKCDISKCQEIALNRNEFEAEPKPDPMAANNNSTPGFNDFTNIKNQIAERYFAEYDAQRLKIITDVLGCKTIDCPQLLSATNIDYNILDVVGKKYIGRGDRVNKIVIQSTDTEVANSSPSKQIIRSISYFLKCIQSLTVTITKTTQVHSEKSVNIWIFKSKSSFTFTHKEETTTSETNETTIFFPSQNITVEPFTKMNTTFNFFQYDDINNYFVDFEIAENSTISHPEVDANSNLVFVKKPLGDFLTKNVDFLPTLKYENDTVLKLVENDDKLILKNFPMSEKITGYGVDVVFGKAGNV